MYANIPGYTLMVAGQRSGKTSFLRLLLDTSNIAPTVSKEQLTPLAKFIQGSNGHTSHIRHVSVDVILDSPDSGAPQPVSLTLIDTPSLDFSDEVSSERVITDILDHIDSRFADGSDDVSSSPSNPPLPFVCPSCDPDSSRFSPFFLLRDTGNERKPSCSLVSIPRSSWTRISTRCMRSGLINHLRTQMYILPGSGSRRSSATASTSAPCTASGQITQHVTGGPAHYSRPPSDKSPRNAARHAPRSGYCSNPAPFLESQRTADYRPGGHPHQ